ncbi:unnamed protein product [Moneuplotes crassus]|uniref:Uncharacterized protein n=1 Tax=Euplotes crassus TaxID=5936 RepID=A0AAD1U516_EUPCR|nr:unnamed protein product [Moneuplotes crassus]
MTEVLNSQSAHQGLVWQDLKSMRAMTDSIIHECSGYSPVLMFMMGASYSKVQEELTLEAFLEIAAKIQAKIQYFGQDSSEAKRIYKELNTKADIRDVLNLPFFKMKTLEEVKGSESSEISKDSLKNRSAMESNTSEDTTSGILMLEKSWISQGVFFVIKYSLHIQAHEEWPCRIPWLSLFKPVGQ